MVSTGEDKIGECDDGKNYMNIGHSFFRKTIALPAEHGSWIFLFGPLIIGITIGGGWQKPATFWLIVGSFAAFLLRQPITIIVKAYSKRRSRKDLPAAWFWVGIYTLAGSIALVQLIAHGMGYLLYLALPAVPVFLWHLYLISKRAERHKMNIEIVGSGTLALAAPAGYWVGRGNADVLGWMLWLLIWFQSAGSIVFIYLRLAQREMSIIPPMKQRFRMGWRALLYSTFNLIVVAVLGMVGVLPSLLSLAYALQWAETLWGTFRPVTREVKPTVLGFRQLGVSILFTLIFIVTWMLA